MMNVSQRLTPRMPRRQKTTHRSFRGLMIGGGVLLCLLIAPVACMGATVPGSPPFDGYPWFKGAICIAILTGLVVAIVVWIFLNRRLKAAIEARNTAQAALRMSDQKFRRLVEESPVVYEMYDREGVQRMVNRAYGELWGIHPRTTLNTFNIRKTLQGDGFLGPFLERAYAGEVVEVPDIYWDAGKEIGEGRARWISFKIYPIFDAHGEVDHIVILHQDLTDRKRSLSALKESEEKFRNFAEQSLVGMYLIQDGVFKYVNPKFAEAHGYSVEECLNNMPVTNLIHPDDRPKVEKQMGRRLSGETRTSHYTFRAIKKDGSVRYAEVFGAALTFEGRPAITGTFLDVTEKVEIENNLRQARKMEAVGTLAGGIAHEFNNVLGIIIGNTELGIDDLPEWNPARKNFEEIKNAGLRARDVVKQLLDFSRSTDSVMQRVDLAAVVNESRKLVRASIPATIEIHSRIPERVYPVEADANQIHQMILNICTNAAHAMSEEGGRLDIILENQDLNAGEAGDMAPGAYVRLRFQDTGHGIAPELLDKIFDPYFTTREVGRGAGMGLAVIHGIVKAHKGNVTVQSTVGKGTTFDILLPATTEDQPLADGTDTDTPGGDERILFVDDEPALVESNSKLLGRLGYRVTSRTDPMEAIEIFRSNPHDFDLVITDMTMPKITGDRLAKDLMALRPDIPIIICTGYSERLDKAEARKAGIHRCIDKPLKISETARIIREVLDSVNPNVA